jgi:hypothetical protein
MLEYVTQALLTILPSIVIVVALMMHNVFTVTTGLLIILGIIVITFLPLVVHRTYSYGKKPKKNVSDSQQTPHPPPHVQMSQHRGVQTDNADNYPIEEEWMSGFN